MSQTKERLEKLADKFKAIKRAIYTDGSCVLTPAKKKLFLSGFALASWHDDIIFQMAWSFGRCPLEELESFLDDNLEQIREFNIEYKVN
jgi:hypothetical protein|tara:strand:+ start:1086 stop:1352 length:267 start_codon:yes stop_codon:yes gene_type:complete